MKKRRRDRAPPGAAADEAATAELESNAEPAKKRKKRAKAAADATPAAAPEASAEPAAQGKKRKQEPQAVPEAAAPPAVKREREPEAVPEAAVPPATKRRSGKALKAAKRRAGREAAADAAGEGESAAAAAGDGASEAPASGGDSGSRQAVGRTVFVDGLPYTWTAEKVREYFAECGEVAEVRAPTWQDSGRLRGFAHVTFADAGARGKALKMDGAQVGAKGRYLKIEAAKPPKDIECTASVDDPARFEGKRRLFAKNLPYDASEAEVVELFRACGKIAEVRIPASFGRCKGFAYVEFASSKGLQAAVALKPPPSLRGRVLQLDADEGRGPKAGFHYRPQAIQAGFGPGAKSAKGEGRGGGRGGGGRGREGGRGGRGGPPKLSLF